MVARLLRALPRAALLRALGLVALVLLLGGASLLAVAASPGYAQHGRTARSQTAQAPLVPAGTVSSTWYFAEGFTGTGYTEYLTLANFTSTAATATVTYYLDSGSPITKNYAVIANGRTTVTVSSDVGSGHNVAMGISSTQPIVAERPMYFDFGSSIPGGTDVLGATSLGTSYTIPYLDTTANHSNYLAVLNPSTSSMTATIKYYPAAGGTPVTATHTVAAQSRGTVNVGSESGIVSGAYYWAQVTLSTAGLVERSLYLQDTATGYTGGGTIVGVTAPQSSWSFAEGHTASTYSERYVLVNPSLSTSTLATLTLYKLDGTTAVTQVALAPGELELVSANNLLGSAADNGAQVQATGAIFAERVMSVLYTGGIGGSGSSSIPCFTETVGTPLPGEQYYFAEGFTGTNFEELLSLLNPDPSTTATVTVTLQPAGGGSPTIKTYTVNPHTRATENISSVLSGQNISMLVQSTVSIVAERELYFDFGGTDTGADAVVGYQP
jgi:hypothetical protein